ncbi:hypothetical protein NQZ68_000403 [Dissostichus eleginoides]|nr:hypothetical protein NQZ68_000403 [Dissostichus eleginoides]
MQRLPHWVSIPLAKGGWIGNGRAEWATETGKRGNPGRLRGLRWAYSVPARATTAHIFPSQICPFPEDNFETPRLPVAERSRQSIKSDFLRWDEEVGMTSVPGGLLHRTHSFVDEDDDF